MEDQAQEWPLLRVLFLAGNIGSHSLAELFLMHQQGRVRMSLTPHTGVRLFPISWPCVSMTSLTCNVV